MWMVSSCFLGLDVNLKMYVLVNVVHVNFPAFQIPSANVMVVWLQARNVSPARKGNWNKST